jgi:hypothetical protein
MHLFPGMYGEASLEEYWIDARTRCRLRDGIWLISWQGISSSFRVMSVAT